MINFASKTSVSAKKGIGIICIMETKEEKYVLLIEQAKSLFEAESDSIANMANISALLKETFNFWWCGFYIVKGEQLVLGPFQGPLACTRIRYGKGVCGTSWAGKRTVVVPDVNEFPGHIACSAASRSEIVIPIFAGNTVTAVLDIDSEHLSTFDDTDARYLQQLCTYIKI